MKMKCEFTVENKKNKLNISKSGLMMWHDITKAKRFPLSFILTS